MPTIDPNNERMVKQMLKLDDNTIPHPSDPERTLPAPLPDYIRDAVSTLEGFMVNIIGRQTELHRETLAVLLAALHMNRGLQPPPQPKAPQPKLPTPLPKVTQPKE